MCARCVCVYYTFYCKGCRNCVCVQDVYVCTTHFIVKAVGTEYD